MERTCGSVVIDLKIIMLNRKNVDSVILRCEAYDANASQAEPRRMHGPDAARPSPFEACSAAQCATERAPQGDGDRQEIAATLGSFSQTHLRILAADSARALLDLSTLLSQEDAGKAGCRPAPAVRCAKSTRRKTAQQHTGVANHSAFPAQWSDGLCRALPGAELSFWPPSPRELTMPSARLGSRTSPQRLDRSNDGQDHTVLPYALSAARPHEASGSQGLPALPTPLAHDAAASTATPLAYRDDVRSPLKDEPGWTTHTSFPNFGKVEYFCEGGLTASAVFCPSGNGLFCWIRFTAPA
jgi:hypothetical protein